MAPRVSEQLKTEIRLLREEALLLRLTVSNPSLLRRLDHAMMELDAIPRLFDSTDSVRDALVVPAAWIKSVREATAKSAPEA